MKRWIAVATLATAFCAAGVVQAEGQQGKPPARVRTRMDGFDLSANSGKKANQVGAASRGLGAPSLFAPNVGKDFSTHPTFYWASPEKGDKVTFRLTQDNGQTLYEKATTQEWLRYPDDAPALTAGKSYKWTIVPENDMLGGPPAPVTFQIVSGKDRDAMEKQLKAAGNADAMAKVFMDNRVWYDAVAGYSDVLDRMPNDQDARAARAAIYDQLAVTKPLAEADWRMVH
jgi:hypothetical protein